jgi:hypothetical protein
MSNLETLLHDSIAVSELPTKLKKSRKTIQRWLTHGVRGAVLKSYRIGGRRYVSSAVVENFIRQSAPDADPFLPTPTAKQATRRRNARIKIAEKFLDEELGPTTAR